MKRHKQVYQLLFVMKNEDEEAWTSLLGFI